MSELTPPEKPRFVSNITSGQKIMASVAGSMFVMALVTLIPWVINSFFAPNFIYQLSILRACMAATSLILGGWVGVQQIIYLFGVALDFYNFYKKFSDFKKKDEEN